MMTTLCNIHFRTAEQIKDMKTNTTMTSPMQVISTNHSSGWIVTKILGRGRTYTTAHVREKITMDVCSKAEHIPEI